MRNQKLSIIALGLRRSGTTAFWRAFRQDRRFLCFDEPLNPFLRELPGLEPKQTRDEYLALFRPDPAAFWARFAPISNFGELTPTLSKRQKAWLSYLLAQADTVFVDETRLHLNVKTLKDVAPEAYLVHLYRNASAFASSHLLPSEGARLRSSVHRQMRKVTFWTRTDDFDSWGVQSIVGWHREQRFGLLLQRHGLDARAILAGPAVVKLLAYWIVHYREICADGSTHFGPRFRSVSFEKFAANPLSVLRDLYNWWGLPPSNMTYPWVRAAHPGHRPSSRRWTNAARLAGFTEQEIAELL